MCRNTSWNELLSEEAMLNLGAAPEMLPEFALLAVTVGLRIEESNDDHEIPWTLLLNILLAQLLQMARPIDSSLNYFMCGFPPNSWSLAQHCCRMVPQPPVRMAA